MKLVNLVRLAQSYQDLSLGAQNVLAGGDGFSAGRTSVAEAVEFLREVLSVLDGDEDESLVNDCVHRIYHLRGSGYGTNLR